MSKALYTGSFDPITMGHLDIIRRGSLLFDEMVVGIVYNPNKKPLFTMGERLEMVKDATLELSNVKVETFQGLLADYVNDGGFDVVIRGLRATSDFEYEIQMAQMNARLFKPGVESVFLMTSPEFSFISSSMIKEVVTLGGSVDGLVPQQVMSKIEEKLKWTEKEH